MPFTVDWYKKEDCILLVEYFHQYSIADIKKAMLQLDDLAKQIPKTQRYDVIVNLLDASYTPPVGLLWAWKKETEQREITFPNWELMVYVSTNEVRYAYFTTAIQTSNTIKKHARICDTIEQAVQIIMADRE